jgi:hypothetical protein
VSEKLSLGFNFIQMDPLVLKYTDFTFLLRSSNVMQTPGGPIQGLGSSSQPYDMWLCGTAWQG